MNGDILKTALEYAASGWSVFPLHSPFNGGCSCGDGNCKNIGKHPRTNQGLIDGTKDPKQIREWLKKWPDANIGVVTGENSGIVVLDIDEGKGGPESLKRLEEENGALPMTAEAKTGGGGRHLVFKHPGRTIKNRTAFVEGLDFRGDGGYIVAAPSLHASGNRYEWINHPQFTSLAELPDWLLGLIDGRVAENGKHVPFDTPGALAGLPDGQRDDALFRMICKFRHADIPEDIAGELGVYAAKKCIPPFEEEVILEKVKRVYNQYPAGSTPFPFPHIYNGNGETESFNPISFSELMAVASQNTDWLVDRILPVETVGILAGVPAAWKSWMLIDLAIEVSRGGKWLGNFQTQRGSVLYIDEESSPGLLGKRFRQVAEPKGISGNIPDIHFLIGQGLCLSNPNSVEKLRCLLEKYRPKFVIVDALIRVHSAEENSAKEMAQVFAIVKDLIRQYGCTMVFADHQKKPSQHGFSQEFQLRGSSEKLAFIDTLLSVHGKGDTRTVEHSKSRHAEAEPPFLISLTDTDSGGVIVSYEGSADLAKQEERLGPGKEFLRKVLTGEWVARKQLVEQAGEEGIPQKVLDEALRTWETENRIEKEYRKPPKGRGGKAAYYRLPDDWPD